MAAAVFSLALLLVPVAAAAQTSCFTIADPDQRAYCRALRSRSSGDCVAITDTVLRTTCFAKFGGGKPADRCNSPALSSWERERCRNEAGPR